MVGHTEGSPAGAVGIIAQRPEGGSGVVVALLVHQIQSCRVALLVVFQLGEQRSAVPEVVQALQFSCGKFILLQFQEAQCGLIPLTTTLDGDGEHRCGQNHQGCGDSRCGKDPQTPGSPLPGLFRRLTCMGIGIDQLLTGSFSVP